MEFSTEQQTEVDRLIKDAYTRAYGKAEDKNKDAVSDAVAAAVAAAETKYKADMATAATKYDELKATKATPVDTSATDARIKALEEENSKNREKGIVGGLESITARLNAVDPAQAALLIRMQTKTDDNGNLVVINAEGQSRMNGDNKPMTTEELCTEFLTSNPHFVKASGSSGAGSKVNTGIDTGTAKVMKRDAYDGMTPQAQSDFCKSGGTLED